MSETIVLFPPTLEDEPYRWLHIADDAVIARGEGVPTPLPADAQVICLARYPATTHPTAASTRRRVQWAWKC